jgi:hypothetical protein
MLPRTPRICCGCKTRKKQYEEELPLTRTNENVFQAILAYLKRAKRELKGRYLDTELFEILGPHVDWIGLIEKHGT